MRGRKLPFLPLDDILADVEIYPREGTETRIARCASPAGFYVEIYPREGTETQLHLFDLERGNVEIYPREGTETGRSVREFRAQRVEIYPREGTET